MFARTERAKAFRAWVLDVLDGLTAAASPAGNRFRNLDAGLMAELRRSGPRYVQGYLAAHGVTSDYAAGLIGVAPEDAHAGQAALAVAPWR